MRPRARRICATPGHIHTLGTSERCPDRPAWGGTSQRQRTGKRGLDDATRMRILRRDFCVCQECGAHSANHVDHIVPRAEGGADEESNLITLCSRCHARKSGREGVRARNRTAASTT